MGRTGYGEVVLLTGFPSFLARKLAFELLGVGPDGEPCPAPPDVPTTLVHAVVHRKFARDAVAIRDALPEPVRARLELVEGDAASMDLGLSGAEFRAFTSEVDRIHHAAQVSFRGIDLATAAALNVGGTREILEFARATPGLKNLVFHSTAAVSGDREGYVDEDDLYAGQKFRNAVEETKARAERMVRDAWSTVPATVVRPSTLIGDSRTGEVDRLDGPYLLILLILASPPDVALPLPARGDTPLHLVPVDYVARASVAIGRHPQAPGRTVHLVDPAPFTARQVFERVAVAGGRRIPRGFIPANLTKALLRTPGLERFSKSPRAFVEAFATPVTYGTRNADHLLSESHIACPRFDSYVDKLVDHVQRRLRERRTRRPDAVSGEGAAG